MVFFTHIRRVLEVVYTKNRKNHFWGITLYWVFEMIVGKFLSDHAQKAFR